MGKGLYFRHIIKNLPISFSYKILHKNPKINAFLGQKLPDIALTHDYLKKAILEGKPFAAIRIGGMETGALHHHEKIALGLEKHFPERTLFTMKNNAGFYPATEEMLGHYGDELLAMLKEADVLGILGTFMESYIAKLYCPDAYFLRYEFMEPLYGDWSSALKGKKVLVISPFEKEIKRQYERRESLFPSKPELLPPFDLKVIASPLTLGEEAGESDFFHELQAMYEKMDATDYDVALIGAGAYGSFLAIHAKRMGKIAIQTGGATQTLFGIMGKRWEKREHVAQYCNPNWIRPEYTPKGAQHIDGGAYW